MNGGTYELPYNMPPERASHPGEKEISVDLSVYDRNRLLTLGDSNLGMEGLPVLAPRVGTRAATAGGDFGEQRVKPALPASLNVGVNNLPQTPIVDGEEALLTQQTQSNIFWNVERVKTVAMPWLPFFSNCDGFDSHVIVWDLLEQPEGRLAKDAPLGFASGGFAGAAGYEGPGDLYGCKIFNPDEVQKVAPLVVNPDTLEMQMSAVADFCSFVIECRYEESMYNRARGVAVVLLPMGGSLSRKRTGNRARRFATERVPGSTRGNPDVCRAEHAGKCPWL